MSDDPLLNKIIEEEGLRTSAARPSMMEWLNDISSRFLDEAVERLLPGVGVSAPWIAGVILVISLLLAVLIAVQLVRFARGAAPVHAAKDADAVALPTSTPPRTRADIDRCLAADDASGALRALWAWVAADLERRGYARSAPDRTNRELLAEVRRSAPDWGQLAAFKHLTDAVDGHLYGAVPLDTRAVRILLPLADELTR